MDRDYAADFAAYLDKHQPTGDFVIGPVATELVWGLRESDPDLLQGWLQEHAVAIVADCIRARQRAARSRAASQAKAVAFGDAADRFSAGDSAALSPFTAHLVVNEKNLRRPVKDMTKEDHLFVAGAHEARSNAALLLAAFHKAIAKRIPPGKTTSDVFSEEEYLALRNSIGARPAA
jgi:hypothetical protein